MSRREKYIRYILGHVVSHSLDWTGGTLFSFCSHSIYKGFERSKKPEMNCGTPTLWVPNRNGSPNIRSKGREPVWNGAPGPRSSKYFHVWGLFYDLFVSWQKASDIFFQVRLENVCSVVTP